MDISMERKCIRNWAGLPIELLEETLSHLYGEDAMAFRLVCRNWHAAEVCALQKEHNPLVFPVPRSQWLLHKHCSELTYKFIHPVYPNVRYAKNLREEAESMDDDAISRYSKDGWLLMSLRRRSLFFFCPFPKKVLELPGLPQRWLYELDGATFTCPPTSGCCVVFVIACYDETYVTIATIRFGKKNWKVQNYYNNNNILFGTSVSNPVFHKEKFYCSSNKGKLGAYNYEEDTWTVFEIPSGERKRKHENFLVEHEEGLMSVLIGVCGSWILIYKLNEPDMVWESVYSLGEHALFASVQTCFATKSVFAMMKNKVFFPWLHNNYVIFYCLETQTFRTYGSGLQAKSLYRTEIAELTEICWIEPREICCLKELGSLSLETNVDDETDDNEWEIEL